MEPMTLRARIAKSVANFLSGPIMPTQTQQGGAYAPTDRPYLPSHLVFPVDGARYGSSQLALESIRTAEEFSIAVKRLAEAISSLEYRVTDTAKHKLNDVHPLAVLLDQPNPLQDWSTWIETAVYMLLPTGNVFILKDPMSMAGTPLALWLLRSDRTRPIRGDQPNAPVTGFEHYAEDGERYVFETEAVIHIKTANPFTPYQGLGVSQLIPTTMAMDAASLAFNWMFFKQGGRLSTVIEMEKKLGKEAWKEMQDKMSEAYMGTMNAHRLMVLDNGAKLNTAASNANPKEVDFPETRKDISRVSGAIMGVPPIHMGHVDNANRSNSVTQDQIFYKQGVKPIAMRLARALTQIAKTFGKYKFEFVLPNVEDPDVLTARATAGSQSAALSPNDIRELWGEERVADPAMDQRFLPFNMQPLDVIVADPALDSKNGAAAQESGGGLPLPAKLDGAGGNAPPSVTGAAGRDGSAGSGSSLPVVPKLALKSEADGAFPKGTELQRRVLKFGVDSRPTTERRLTKQLRAWIRTVGDAAAEQLEAGSVVTRSLEVVAKAVDDSAHDLQMKLDPLLDGEMQAFYQALGGLFKTPEADQTFLPGSVSYAGAKARLAQRVTGVSNAIKSSIEDVVREGMAQGLSVYEIANGTSDGSFEGIRDVVDGMAQERATLIARTETVELQKQASLGAYQDLGVTVVDVIGCEDFVVMPGQRYGCNSQGVPLNEAWAVEFHPNHRGAIVPRLEKAIHSARLLALR